MAIEIYSDGADFDSILELNKNPIVSGFTTNPSLLKKAGVTNYEEFARKILAIIKDKPFSFEVLSDDLEEMVTEAEKISSWGENVFVKIPPMNTKKKSTKEVIKFLVDKNIKLNLTAIFTYKQIEEAIDLLCNNTGIISIFAGRIIDAGYDAVPFFKYASYYVKRNQKILWASTRGLWNIKQAEEGGADIITIQPEILNKLSLWGKDLYDFSWETVCMFRNDAKESGFTI